MFTLISRAIVMAAIIIGERAKRVRHPLLLPIEKMFGLYVKTTMHMLTILREAEEWTRVHLREDCLLFASAITKTRQNSMVDTTQTSKTFFFFFLNEVNH